MSFIIKEEIQIQVGPDAFITLREPGAGEVDKLESLGSVALFDRLFLRCQGFQLPSGAAVRETEKEKISPRIKRQVLARALSMFRTTITETPPLR